MDQVKVQFRTPEEVMDFTNVVSRYECDMDLKKSSKKVVDAKSLLGILALGLENVPQLFEYRFWLEIRKFLLAFYLLEYLFVLDNFPP